ncbi:hypothetical protein [Novosphingobium sp. BL-52-GroH]|uniref:hypothetical protein n=1 Tax=Novosphingobium sp. BL-52-GroH TaxID=3349877 RepID=UPI0038506A88
MPNNPIQMPSGYATAFAIGFADPASGDLSIVESSRPLPVTNVAASAAEPLSGVAYLDGTFGPFLPTTQRPVLISLEGTWTGTVTIRRSVDGGQTMQALTIAGEPWGIYRNNACEVVWEEIEEGAALYLSATIATGSLVYRLSQ